MEKAIATLTIHGVSEMSDKERVDLVAWLQERIKDVRNKKLVFAKRFTARLF